MMAMGENGAAGADWAHWAAAADERPARHAHVNSRAMANCYGRTYTKNGLPRKPVSQSRYV